MWRLYGMNEVYLFIRRGWIDRVLFTSDIGSDVQPDWRNVTRATQSSLTNLNCTRCPDDPVNCTAIVYLLYEQCMEETHGRFELFNTVRSRARYWEAQSTNRCRAPTLPARSTPADTARSRHDHLPIQGVYNWRIARAAGLFDTYATALGFAKKCDVFIESIYDVGKCERKITAIAENRMKAHFSPL